MASSEALAKIPGIWSSTKSGDILSPIFIKELRQGLRANQFVWPFIVVQIAAIACVSIEFVTVYILDSNNFLSQTVFYWLVGIVMGAILPLTQFGALQPELSSGRNVELLLMSNLSRWQIVLGKWAVGSALSMLMLVSLLPYWIVRYMIGSIGNIGTEISIIITIIVANAMINSIVIGASGFRNYVGRAAMILLSLGCCAATFSIVVFREPLDIFDWYKYVAGVIAAALIVCLNLQLGRAKLRLYENPLDPPSSALIIVLIICTWIVVGIARMIVASTMSFDVGAMVMAGLLLWLTLMIDPGPGKKNRRWAQA